MTEALASKTCTPCRGGIPPLTREQAELFHAQAPDWQLAEEAHRIERSFRFRNFREALTFVQEIGELAEAEGHHPNISFGWGNATVSLQTKKIKGLHENDFIMATKIDRIFARTATAKSVPVRIAPSLRADMIFREGQGLQMRRLTRLASI
jgi:4a-hydroxytetrahydrobiopterin dehydratase